MELIRESQCTLKLTAADLLVAIRSHFGNQLRVEIPADLAVLTPLPDEIVLGWSAKEARPGGPPAYPAFPFEVTRKPESTVGF